MKYILVGLLACYVIALVVIQIKAAIIWERIGNSKKRIETMKYKVGDKVRIKSLDWYNKNKDKYGRVACGYHVFTQNMSKFCGRIMQISSKTNLGVMNMCDNTFYWTDEMVEGLVEEENEKKLSDESWRYKNIFDSSQYPQSFELPEGYIFKDENGNVINATKIVLEKKKKEYPKTYEECCKILDWNHRDYDRVGYKSELLCKLQVLLLCLDAYWKIAGDEMGLDKPWEPTDGPYVYCIYTYKGEIFCDTPSIDCVLSFPTEEMRDAFYENFKSEIEICKELL